jgi:hypothetical protein
MPCHHKGAKEMNNDMNDAQGRAKTETVPAALLDLHQRLLEDGATWRADLPFSAMHATQALAEQTAPQGRKIDRNGRMPVMTQPPTLPRRDVTWTRRPIASAADIVVVGLLAALFATFALHRIGAHLTSGVYNPSPTTMAPASTPGPATKYTVSVVTARSVDSNFAPIDITSRFPVNSQVHLVIQVRNVTAGEKHTVSVRWFLNGTDLQLPSGPRRTSAEVKDNSSIHFAVVCSTAGIGMAKIYWDRPANDTNDTDTDPSLAQTITFTVERQS